MECCVDAVLCMRVCHKCMCDCCHGRMDRHACVSYLPRGRVGLMSLRVHNKVKTHAHFHTHFHSHIYQHTWIVHTHHTYKSVHVCIHTYTHLQRKQRMCCEWKLTRPTRTYNNNMREYTHTHTHTHTHAHIYSENSACVAAGNLHLRLDLETYSMLGEC